MGLKRVLGPADAAWIVAGNMIGAGIFAMPGLVTERLPGTFWPLAAWALGGLLALCGAAVYAELGARLPRAGGDYQYLRVAFGPLWGFLTGWAAMTLTFSAAAAAMSIVAVNYLQTAVPLLANAPVWILAPAFVLLLTVANVTGARVSGRTTTWFTAIPLGGLLVLFGLGLARGEAAVHWPEAGSLSGAWPVAFGAAMLPVFFTYSGWNAAAYVAGELRDPGRNLARGLLVGTMLVTIVYLLINTVFLVVIPPEQLAGKTTAGADAARLLLGPVAARALALLIAIAVLGSVNVTLMAGSRIYYAMAMDALAPRALGRTNAAGVPSTALWAGGIWSALLALTDMVELLVNWASLAILLLSSLAVVALFVLRRRGGEEPAYHCTAYPLTPAVYLIVSFGVACGSAVVFPWEALYGVLIVAAGVPLYWVLRRVSRGRPVV
jgi:APA family basic amino acid/polyamine antiporter